MIVDANVGTSHTNNMHIERRRVRNAMFRKKIMSLKEEDFEWRYITLQFGWWHTVIFERQKAMHFNPYVSGRCRIWWLELEQQRQYRIDSLSRNRQNTGESNECISNRQSSNRKLHQTQESNIVWIETTTLKPSRYACILNYKFRGSLYSLFDFHRRRFSIKAANSILVFHSTLISCRQFLLIYFK